MEALDKLGSVCKRILLWELCPIEFFLEHLGNNQIDQHLLWEKMWVSLIDTVTHEEYAMLKNELSKRSFRGDVFIEIVERVQFDSTPL
jgi:hypothetical protein